MLPDAFDASDAGSEVRTEETGVERLVCKPAHRR
jgi:hypothetical protein